MIECDYPAFETERNGELTYYLTVFGETFTAEAPNTTAWRDDEDPGRFYEEYETTDNADFMSMCEDLAWKIADFFEAEPVYRILAPDSEEVAELQRRWKTGDKKREANTSREYSGYFDIGVYALLDTDGAPVRYIEIDPLGDIDDIIAEMQRLDK